MRIASFDIGIRNFAQYIEDVDVQEFKRLKEQYFSLPLSKRKYSAAEVQEILWKLCLTGRRVQTGVYSFGEGGVDMQVRRNLISHLERFRKVWKECDVFVVERQFCRVVRSVEPNMRAIRIAECTMAWFLSNFPEKEVVNFDSQNKTRVFGCPKMSKNERKKWAELKVREIYEAREDTDMIELFALKERVFRKRLNTEEKVQEMLMSYAGNAKVMAEKIVRDKQKLDDIGDACVQCQAFKMLRLK